MKKNTKKEERKIVKPTLVVQRKDKYGHDVFECKNREDAEKLRRAFTNPMGVVVKEPKEKEKRCPVEPEKPYKNSVCGKVDELFERLKKKRAKKSRK